MDEPASALDPISTGKIEEAIEDLKNDYTIVIVTHNMQQAARISDYTAFMMLGEMIEMDNTKDIFSKPDKNGKDSAGRRAHHWPGWISKKRRIPAVR